MKLIFLGKVSILKLKLVIDKEMLVSPMYYMIVTVIQPKFITAKLTNRKRNS